MLKQKLLIRTIAIVLAASATTLIAAPADRPGGNADRQHPGHNAGPRMKVIRLFKALDTDQNRIITLDEFLAKPVEKAATQFDRIDTNDDGLISFEEAQAAWGDRPERDIDVDAVRACVAAETGEDVPEPDDLASRFDTVDTNGDGFIDLPEFIVAKTDKATVKFNRIDSDADGGITPQELFAAFQGHRERRQVRRDCVEMQQEIEALLEG